MFTKTRECFEVAAAVVASILYYTLLEKFDLGRFIYLKYIPSSADLYVILSNTPGFELQNIRVVANNVV